MSQHTSVHAQPSELTAQQVAAFERDGFVVVNGLYNPHIMLQWKQIMQDVLSLEGDEPSSSGVRVWMSDHIHPVLRDAMADEHVVRMLTQVIGPNVEFLSAKAVFKNSTTSFASPWHQDYFYWGGSNKLSIWIALDDATVANGCLMFVPGSYRKHFTKQVVDNENAFVNRVYTEDLADWPKTTIEVKRGDAVIFHDMAVHSSHPNTTGADRWSLISTYRDASIVDASTVWRTAMVVAGKSVNV